MDAFDIVELFRLFTLFHSIHIMFHTVQYMETRREEISINVLVVCQKLMAMLSEIHPEREKEGESEGARERDFR